VGPGGADTTHGWDSGFYRQERVLDRDLRIVDTSWLDVNQGTLRRNPYREHGAGARDQKASGTATLGIVPGPVHRGHTDRSATRGNWRREPVEQTVVGAPRVVLRPQYLSMLSQYRAPPVLGKHVAGYAQVGASNVVL